MTKSILLIAILFIVFGCKKEESNKKFKYLEFSFDNTFETSFSIKFTPDDSIYIREHWNSSDVWDSVNIPRGKTNYIAVINKKDRKDLCNLISKTQLKKYDPQYYENYVDGMSYAFYIDKDSIKKSIYIHSYKNEVPKELDSLGKWIYNWKKKTKLIRTNKELTFTTSKYVLPPPPPPLKNK